VAKININVKKTQKTIPMIIGTKSILISL